MARLTVLSSQELESIIDRYPVGKLLSSTPMDGGLANSSVYIAAETGSYILSVCDEKEIADIVRLCSVLEELEKHDFPTTRVVRTRTGDSYLVHREKPLYLKRYIDGAVIDELSDRQLFQVGEALARLHEIPPHPSLQDRFSYGTHCFEELENVASAGAFYRWLSSCRTLIDAACMKTLPRGFVHGDLFADNMLFIDDKLAALLDFEEACCYYKIFDIGMTAVGCCAPAGLFSAAKTAALVAGYQSIRRLQPEERSSLQAHAAYGAAATAFWRFRQDNIRNPNPAMKNHYQAMKDLADQVLAIAPERFINSIFDLQER